MTTTRSKTRRLEVRTTASERELIDRAVAASGSDLTTFVVSELTESARRVLADRQEFALSGDAAAEWERVNRLRPRDLAGLRRLMDRPSPFTG